jgi:hypothetical protein
MAETYPTVFDPITQLPPPGGLVTETPTLPPVAPVLFQIGFRAQPSAIEVTGYTEDFTGTPPDGTFFVDTSTDPQTLVFALSAVGASVEVKYLTESSGQGVVTAIDVASLQIAILQKVLGLSPQATARDVAARIAALELNLNRPISGSRIQGQYTGTVTGMWTNLDYSRMWFCTDTGEVWTATNLDDWVLQLKATDPTNGAATPLRCGTVSGNSLWAAGDVGIWESRDSGTTWSQIVTSPVATSFRKIHAVNISTLFAVGFVDTLTAGENAVIESTDGGRTWVTLVVSPSDGLFTSVRMSAITHGVAVTEGGRIFYTTDTKTWIESLNGTSKWTQQGINDVYVFGAAPTGRFRIVENSGVIRRSDNTGVTWTAETTPLSGVQLLAIFARSATDWVAVGTSAKAIETTDGDTSTPTWAECDTGIVYSTLRAVIWGIDLDQNGIRDIVAGGDFFLGRAEHPTCVFSNLYTGVSPKKLALTSLFALEIPQEFTTTANQNQFSLQYDSVPNSIAKVYRNGIKVVASAVVLVDGVVTVSWDTPMIAGETVEILFWRNL